jgi:hypothetical protein
MRVLLSTYGSRVVAAPVEWDASVATDVMTTGGWR